VLQLLPDQLQLMGGDDAMSKQREPFLRLAETAEKTMVRSLVWMSFLVASLVSWAAAAQGPIVGDVEGGAFRPFPLAVPVVRGAAAAAPAAATFTQVLRADLQMSGAFRLLDDRSFIDSDGIAPGTVRFGDWQNVGAQGVVKAQLSTSGGSLSLSLYAYEIAAARTVLDKKLDGSVDDVRALAHAAADEVFRAFTGEPGPFRSKIAVVKKVQGEKHVFIVDVDGEGARQVTKGGGLNLLPSWSPDGRSILFTSYRFDNPDLFEQAVDGTSPRAVSRRPGLNTGGRMSPDGTKIAVTLSQDGNSELYLLDRAGGIVKRLTDQWGIDTSPSWSPDGSQLAFVSSRGGNPDIYVMPSSGGAAKRLTFRGEYNQTPAFSPRGTHVAFTARDERNAFDIFVLNLKTNELKRITQGQGNNEEPSFSPNGRLLVFTTTRNKTRQLVIANLDGTTQTVLSASTGEHTSPSWGPFVR
jgi:TolB protein